MIRVLRSGEWLSASRVQRFATASLVVTVLAIGYILATAHGTVDAWGRPVGTDFSNVFAAGRMALEGRAAMAWDWASHHAVQQAIHHDPAIPFYGWHYPPPFLIVAPLLATLPYIPALLVWQTATLAAAVAVAQRIVPRTGVTLAALGFPAVFVCLGHGQNGFLTAALLGGGMLALDRRPWLAGVLLGCLCYKPQFALVLPVMLIAGGHWRATGAATATVAALVALTTAIWGIAVWEAFAQSLALTRSVVIEAADTGVYKIVTTFAAIRLHGGGPTLAYAVQAGVGVTVLLTLVATRHARPAVRGALTVTAALLATPYAFDYDMVALGMAIAFVVTDARDTGWRPWERTLLAAAWFAPLVSRGVAQASGIPLGLLAITAVWVIGLHRGIRSSPCRHLHGSSGR